MKKQYSRKQIQEAISYWRKQLREGNYRKDARRRLVEGAQDAVKAWYRNFCAYFPEDLEKAFEIAGRVSIKYWGDDGDDDPEMWTIVHDLGKWQADSCVVAGTVATHYGRPSAGPDTVLVDCPSVASQIQAEYWTDPEDAEYAPDAYEVFLEEIEKIPGWTRGGIYEVGRPADLKGIGHVKAYTDLGNFQAQNDKRETCQVLLNPYYRQIVLKRTIGMMWYDKNLDMFCNPFWWKYPDRGRDVPKKVECRDLRSAATDGFYEYRTVE